MLSFRLPTREQVIEYLQAKSTAFLHFAYNKENSTYFGRNVTSWGEFYCWQYYMMNLLSNKIMRIFMVLLSAQKFN